MKFTVGLPFCMENLGLFRRSLTDAKLVWHAWAVNCQTSFSTRTFCAESWPDSYLMSNFHCKPIDFETKCQISTMSCQIFTINLSKFQKNWETYTHGCQNSSQIWRISSVNFQTSRTLLKKTPVVLAVLRQISIIGFFFAYR